MAYFAQPIIHDVGRAARIYYVDRNQCIAWNTHRRNGELRLLTGWCWVAKNSDAYQMGFKTKSACIRDVHYKLVQRVEVPGITRRPRPLRLVA